MNYIDIETYGAPIKAWVKNVPVEPDTYKQVQNASKLRIVKGVALMPDCHVGRGSTVGSVVATYEAIVPAMVGVDIGCGMVAVKLDGVNADDLPDTLLKVRTEIEHAVPVGFGVHESADYGIKQIADAAEFVTWLEEKHPKIGNNRKDSKLSTIGAQLGSLGGGNHFIEVCLDTHNELWLMFHSGSRGIGNMIGSYFIELAKGEMLKNDIHLPDKDLSYLKEGTEYFDDYVKAVNWAQVYAARNRADMVRRVLTVLRRHLPAFNAQKLAINCHHNYVQKETHFGQEVWLTRKGAVSARKDELGIIPGSMGAKSFIVRGLGNSESFCSCSHGAGRVMSRSQAKKLITLEDHIKATEGIECRKDEGVIDESPASYKNIDDVMAAQSDLVEIVYTLRQILCVKG